MWYVHRVFFILSLSMTGVVEALSHRKPAYASNLESFFSCSSTHFTSLNSLWVQTKLRTRSCMAPSENISQHMWELFSWRQNLLYTTVTLSLCSWRRFSAWWTWDETLGSENQPRGLKNFRYRCKVCSKILGTSSGYLLSWWCCANLWSSWCYEP